MRFRWKRALARTLTYTHRRGVIYDWSIVRILRRRSGHDKIVNVYRADSYYTIIYNVLYIIPTTTILLYYTRNIIIILLLYLLIYFCYTTRSVFIGTYYIYIYIIQQLPYKYSIIFYIHGASVLKISKRP